MNVFSPTELNAYLDECEATLYREFFKWAKAQHPELIKQFIDLSIARLKEAAARRAERRSSK